MAGGLSGGWAVTGLAGTVPRVSVVPGLPSIAYGVGGAAVGGALIVAVWLAQVALGLVLYGRRPPKQGAEAAISTGLEVPPRPLIVLLSPLPMLAAVALEEYLFRALLLRWLWRYLGLKAALFVSAAVFGALHAFNERPPRLSWAAFGAAAAGLALGAAYASTGSLVHAIGVHFGWNYVQWSVLGYPLYGFGVEGWFVTRPVAGRPEWLTGGRMGPEASVLAIVAMLAAAGAYSLWFIWT